MPTGAWTFFTASVIWGTIGPERVYGPGGLYHPLSYGFIVGALLPIPVYFLTKRYPNSFLKYVHVPLFIGGGIFWSPLNYSYVWPAVVIGFAMNYIIKNRWSLWWQKYAYVLTASFSSATGLSAIIVFFAVQYKIVDFSWWGNTVSYAGCDGKGCPLKKLGFGEHF